MTFLGKLQTPTPQIMLNPELSHHHLSIVKRKSEILARIEEKMGRSWILDNIKPNLTPSETERVLDLIGESKEAVESLAEHSLLEIHPSDLCNLSCRGCAFHHDIEDSLSTQFENLDLLKRGLVLLKPKGVSISGGGEPTLYKGGGNGIGDFIRTIKSFDEDIDIGMITNGTNLSVNDTWLNQLAWLRISLDAGSDEKYLKVKGQPFFNKVCRNLTSVLDMNDVGIAYGYTDDNIDDVAPLIELIDEIVDPEMLSRLRIQFRAWRFEPLDFTAAVISEADLEACSNAVESVVQHSSNANRLTEWLASNTNIGTLVKRGTGHSKIFTGCYSSLAKCLIRADGSIYPCCIVSNSTEFCLGHVSNTTVQIGLNVVRTFTHEKNICVPTPDACHKAGQNRVLGEIDESSMVDPWLNGAFYW